MDFVAALDAVGDASCLDALAKAYRTTPDQWLRDRLARIFRAIVRRERLTRRHAVVRKLRARDPETLEALWP
jgi:UDP-N-acetyl-D-mannosaminuronic acid transferase (WecB/TagA/CpsF family)